MSQAGQNHSSLPCWISFPPCSLIAITQDVSVMLAQRDVFSIQTWDESGGAPHSLNPGTAGGLKASRCALGNTSLLSRLRWFTFAARRPTLDSVKVCD